MKKRATITITLTRAQLNALGNAVMTHHLLIDREVEEGRTSEAHAKSEKDLLDRAWDKINKKFWEKK